MVQFTCTISFGHKDQFKDELMAQAEQMSTFSEGNVRAMEEKASIFTQGCQAAEYVPRATVTCLTTRQREPAYRAEMNRKGDGERKVPWMIMFEPPRSSCA